MEFDSVIRGRRSIRAYTNQTVPEDLIHTVLDEARWTPSWRNTQAWNVWVVSGDALDQFKREFTTAIEHGEPAAMDLNATAEWPQACSARTTTLMKSRAATLEAAGEDTDPAASLLRMADLFDAPCLLVFGFEDCLAEAYASFDSGLFVQSVCLAAHDKGLGTCIVATVVRYPQILRHLLPGADDKRFVVAVTLGYPDSAAPANTFARSRAGLDEIVTWVS
ncbi:MAG: nitroreductase [Thermoleophilia bacterium]